MQVYCYIHARFRYILIIMYDCILPDHGILTSSQKTIMKHVYNSKNKFLRYIYINCNKIIKEP